MRAAREAGHHYVAAPCCFQQADHGPEAEEHPVLVDADEPEVVLHRGGPNIGGPQPDAGVQQHQIDPTVSGGDLKGEVVPCRRVGHVEMMEPGPNLSRHGFAGFGNVGGDDRRPLRGEPLCACSPDARRRSGYQSYFARQNSRSFVGHPSRHRKQGRARSHQRSHQSELRESRNIFNCRCRP